MDDFPYLRSQVLSVLEIVTKMMLELERESCAHSA